MSDSTPAGWYPDAQGGQRWWDGHAWTEHTLPQPPSGPPQGPPQQQAQQGYPRQDFAQQGYPGAPQKSGGVSGKLVAVIGGGVGAVVLVVILLVVLLGGGGSSPKGVVEDYIGALEDGDCDALTDFVVEDLRDSEVQECEEVQGILDGDLPEGVPEELAEEEYDVDFEVGDEQVDGDSATVAVTVSGTAFGQDVDESSEVSLVQEDGDWLIDEFGSVG